MVTRTHVHVQNQRGGVQQRDGVVIPRWRVYAVFLVAVVVVLVVAVRLVDLQVAQHAHLSEMARGEIYNQIVLQPDRGAITDSQGNILALDVEHQSLWVNPLLFSEEEAPRLALTLSSLIDKDPRDLEAVLTNHAYEWVRLARWLEPDVAEQVAALGDTRLNLVYEPRRIYPQETFAAHVIGAVNHNGDGISGVESFYNTQLKGITGTLEAEFDGRQHPIAIAPRQNRPPQHGVQLQLTIDPLVQYVAETELKRAVQEHQASSGTVLVLEPKTGAVRGMATWPAFDPNRYTDYSEEIYSRNPATSSLYEPGSTFKMFVVAAGLQSRAFTAETQVNDSGIIQRGDMRIHNWNYRGNGMITPADMLYYSSNVGAVQFNEFMGAETFYSFVEAFGFGAPTGIDLGGEEVGIVHDPAAADFSPATFATNSYGQGVAVTPLQLVRAAAALANDGRLMRPYVVERYCRQGAVDEESSEVLEEEGGGECVTTQAEMEAQVVEPGVAWTVRRMLARSANHYAPIVWASRTGSYADQWLVPGYEVCAKTGTASIPLPGGGYDPTYVIGSVVGFAPSEDARYAVLVKIDRPRGDVWGLGSAVPAFYRIVDQLMRYERLAPDPSLMSAGQADW
jgi:cell division protein FtsI/penicillin-binding protein 2